MNIILMGAPGAGKGTQSAKIEEAFHLQHISTGDVLREEINSGSSLGKRIASIIDDGNLVPDELMIEMLEGIVRASDKGIIFDGFPRTVAQAKALDEMMAKLGRQIDDVIMITLPEEEIIHRLCTRRQCRINGEVRLIDASFTAEECEARGGEIFTRADDTPERAKHRLEVYHHETEPVKGYYVNSGVYAEVDGNQSPAEVFKHIQAVLN